MGLKLVLLLLRSQDQLQLGWRVMDVALPNNIVVGAQCARNR